MLKAFSRTFGGDNLFGSLLGLGIGFVMVFIPLMASSLTPISLETGEFTKTGAAFTLASAFHLGTVLMVLTISDVVYPSVSHSIAAGWAGMGIGYAIYHFTGLHSLGNSTQFFWVIGTMLVTFSLTTAYSIRFGKRIAQKMTAPAKLPKSYRINENC